MKENRIEELQEKLETLHATQDARLACNADDLDIREEIAEVEEEIKELQDDINIDRKDYIKNERSSIEEDIKILEKFKNNEMQRDKLERDVRCGGWKIGDIYKCLELDNAIDNILSDYKRVLKENELLRKDIEGWKKYCEEIEEEQTEMSNKNCELEFEIEKLQKENEELKNNYINVQDSTNTTFCKVAIPPEPQLPTKTLCESFSKKVRKK